MSRVQPLAGLAVLSALMLSGCGESIPHGRSTEQTVHQFLRAAAARDGNRACALLSDRGKAVMAAYPDAVPASGTAERTCEQTVEQLDAFPHAEAWAAMARGDVTSEAPSGGLDERTVTVTYDQDATTHVQATGRASSPAGPLNSTIDVPPLPR